MPFYAVVKGYTPGIFTTWIECQTQVKGYPNAVFQKFTSELDANKFIQDYQNVSDVNNSEDSDDLNNDIIYIYTDGACSNNGTKNAKAGIGVYVADGDSRNISAIVEGRQTNNVAELTAIIEAYSIIEEIHPTQNKKVVIYSDSIYAIRCATTYGAKQAKVEWSKDIPNKDLVRTIYELYKDDSNISFKHVYAHTDKTDKHSLGNDAADKLANLAIGVTSCPYSEQPMKKRIYLNVPYKDKDDVKELNGKWDKNKKKWYILETNENKDSLLNKFGN